MPKRLKWNKKSRPPYFSEVMGLKNQQVTNNFDEIIADCKMIFDEKRRFHAKWNLYCQTKVIWRRDCVPT